MQKALKTLLALRNAIEVLGEWEAEDRNPTMRAKTRSEVDTAVVAGQAAIAKATKGA